MLRKIKLSVKDFIFSLLSALLLTVPFNHGSFWIFAWFGFIPLFFVLKNKTKLQAFWLAFLTGFIFWLATIYWLTYVTFIGMVLLSLYLAIYFGIFGFSTRLRPTTYDLILFPSVWVILEYARSHLFSGFPWALLGYTQCLNLPIIQFADITGIWGVSFLIILVNVWLYDLLTRKNKLLWPVFILIIVIFYGYFKIYYLRPATSGLPVKISLVQGNIPQELHWDVRAKDFIIDKYFKLTLKAEKENPDLIIWPESSLPVIPEEDPVTFGFITNLIKDIKIPLLLGLVRIDDGNYYNSAVLLSSEGQYISKYDKIHLVPLGEFIPLKNVFPFLETLVPIGDFTRGQDYTVFELQTKGGEIKFSTLVCFEDVFPELSRQFSRRGAQLLVNLTNDGWFGKTPAPYQHLQASVFRAVENRRPLVRAANTGISCFISPGGKITSRATDVSGKDIFVDAMATEQIPIPQLSTTFYTKYGDIFILVCLFLAGGLILVRVK